MTEWVHKEVIPPDDLRPTLLVAWVFEIPLNARVSIRSVLSDEEYKHVKLRVKEEYQIRDLADKYAWETGPNG